MGSADDCAPIGRRRRKLSTERKDRTEAGKVDATLPRGLFRVTLDSGEIVVASIAREARRVLVGIIPGDKVAVEVSPFDPTRGRITSKQRQ